MCVTHVDGCSLTRASLQKASGAVDFGCVVFAVCTAVRRNTVHTQSAQQTLSHDTRLRTDPDDPYKLTDETRSLGLIVCRGTAVTLVCPCEGMAEIANPFAQAEAS